MKILVLGGTGVISRAIVREGIKAGHEMSIFNRGNRTLGFEDQVEVIHGDRKDKESFAAAMEGRSFDVVIDMICFDAEDAKQTVEVFTGKAKQLIVTSSIAAYKRPFKSVPTCEDCEELIDDPGYAYGYKKALMEHTLDEAMEKGSLPITVIRPSLTFGEGCANLGVLRQNYNIVNRMKQGKPLVLPGDGISIWSFTFAPDMGRAYIAACMNPACFNQKYHVMNTELVMWEDLYRTIGKIIGCEPKFAYLPTKALVGADAGMFGHFDYEKKYANYYSIAKFQKACPDFAPKMTLEDGLREIIAWWEAEAHNVDADKDALEDRLCAVYDELCEAVKKAVQ